MELRGVDVELAQLFLLARGAVEQELQQLLVAEFRSRLAQDPEAEAVPELKKPARARPSARPRNARPRKSFMRALMSWNRMMPPGLTFGYQVVKSSATAS